MLGRRGDKEDRDKLAMQRRDERRMKWLKQQEDLKNGLVERMAYQGARVGRVRGGCGQGRGGTGVVAAVVVLVVWHRGGSSIVVWGGVIAGRIGLPRE